MGPVGFKLDFFTVVQRTDTAEKRRLSSRLSFHFFLKVVTQWQKKLISED